MKYIESFDRPPSGRAVFICTQMMNSPQRSTAGRFVVHSAVILCVHRLGLTGRHARCVTHTQYTHIHKWDIPDLGPQYACPDKEVKGFTAKFLHNNVFSYWHPFCGGLACFHADENVLLDNWHMKTFVLCAKNPTSDNALLQRHERALCANYSIKEFPQFLFFF